MKIRLHWLPRIAGVLAASFALAANAASPSPNVQELAWRAALESNQAAAYQAYLAEFPKGKYAPVARVKLAILQGSGAAGNPAAPAAQLPTGNAPTAKTPVEKSAFVRPNLPISIPEEVWQVIERSDFVKHMPIVKPLAASYTERTWQDTLSYYRVKTASHRKIQSAQAGNAPSGIVEVQRQEQMSGTMKSESTALMREFYLGGLIMLGGKMESTEVAVIKKLHELSGSLFPLRIGNEIRIRYDVSGSYEMKYDFKCRVGNMTEAQSFRPGLRGKAWLIVCDTDSTFDGSRRSGTSEMRYLEEYGIFADIFGVPVVTTETSTITIPAPGDTLKYDWDMRNQGGNLIHYIVENYQFPASQEISSQ